MDDLMRGLGSCLVLLSVALLFLTFIRGDLGDVALRWWLTLGALFVLGMAAYSAPQLALVVAAVFLLAAVGIVALMFYIRLKKDRNGPLDTAMLLAGEMGLGGVAAFLVGRGAHAGVSDSSGSSAMYRALEHRDHRSVTTLLARGISPLSPVGPRELPPLVVAAMFDDPASAVVLLKHGADVNSWAEEQTAVGAEHESPLYVALKKKSPLMIALLLSSGANPDIVCSTNTVRGTRMTVRDNVGYYTGGHGPVYQLFEEPGYVQTFLAEVLPSSN